MAEFVKLQATQASSDNSWKINISEINQTTFDLSAKNPNTPAYWRKFNEITQAWADKSIKEYKKLKGLKKENPRDNMSNLELVLNMLAEASTSEISKQQQAH